MQRLILYPSLSDRESYRQTERETVRNTWGSDVELQLQLDTSAKKKKAWRGKHRHVSQLFLPLSSLIWQPTPLFLSLLLPLCLSVSASVPLSCVLCVPSPPPSISLPLMCFGVCYPRVLARCCRHPKAGSGGQLKRRDAVRDIISHCYYSCLTSPHCLKVPGL